MPLVVAICCAVLMGIQEEFYLAMLICAAGVAVLGWAAVGASQTHGYRLGGAGGARWAMGTVLLAGMSFLFFVGSRFAFEYALYTADETARQERRTFPGTYRLKHITYYRMFSDGTFGRQIVKYPPNLSDKDTASSLEYRYERLWPVKEEMADNSEKMVVEGVSMSGSIWQREGFRDLRWQYQELTEPIDEPTTAPLSRENANNQSDAVSYYEPNRRVKERWYYLWPPGIWYGYDGTTHAYLGSVGLDGFVPPGKFATPMGPYNGSGAATTAQGAYDIDPTAHSVTLRWAFPPGEPGLYYRLPRSEDFNNDARNTLGDSIHSLVETNKHLLVYKRGTPQPEISFPLAFGPAEASLKVRHFVDQHRWALWYSPRRDLGHNYVLEFFDEQGTLLTQLNIPEWRIVEWYGATPPDLAPELVPIFRRVATWQGILYSAGGLPWNLSIDYIHPRWLPGTDTSWQSWIETDGHVYYWAIGMTLTATAICIWLLACRYNLRHKWAWAIGALIFGPVMLLVLATTHTLPRRVRCESCGKLRFPAALKCAHCGAVWPAPPRNGTEIFASDATTGD
jgi:hypothetical protein